jgi:hypothetical protein
MVPHRLHAFIKAKINLFTPKEEWIEDRPLKLKNSRALDIINSAKDRSGKQTKEKVVVPTDTLVQVPLWTDR